MITLMLNPAYVFNFKFLQTISGAILYPYYWNNHLIIRKT